MSLIRNYTTLIILQYIKHIYAKYMIFNFKDISRFKTEQKSYSRSPHMCMLNIHIPF